MTSGPELSIANNIPGLRQGITVDAPGTKKHEDCFSFDSKTGQLHVGILIPKDVLQSANPILLRDHTMIKRLSLIHI